MSKQAKRLRKIVSFMLAAIVAVSCFSVSAAAEETDSVSSSEKVNYIANSLDWDKLYAYEWDSDGNPLLGEWPGTTLTEKQVDLYGYDAYSYTVQDGAVGLIISDGRKNITVDITDFSVPEYLISEVRETEYSKFNVIAANTISFEQDDIVFLYGDTNLDQKITISDSTAIAFQLAQLPDSELSYLQKALSDVDGDGDVTIADVTSIQLELAELKTESRTGKKCKTWDSETDFYEYPLQFICPDDWNFAYLYAWDNNNEPLVGEFPGILINNAPNDSGELVAQLPYGCAGYIFSDGGNRQTVDIFPYDSAPNGVFHRLIGTKDSLGHYDVKPVRKGITDPPPYGYIRFVNTPGWENVYVYARDYNGNRITDSWPGNKMDLEYIDENGCFMYIAKDIWNAKEYIFSSGNGEQTTEVSANKSVYTPTNRKDNYGHLHFNDDSGESHTSNNIFVTFTNSCGWKSVYVYAWDEDGNVLCGEWPGKIMARDYTDKNGYPVYMASIPEKAVGMAFASGMNCDETEDVSTDKKNYRPSGNRDERGHIILFGWNDNEQQIRFTNTPGWEKVYCYWRNRGKNSKIQSAKMTYEYTDDNGDKVYTVSIPNRTEALYFRSGGGERTTEVYVYYKNIFTPTNLKDKYGRLCFDDSYTLYTYESDTVEFINSVGWKTVYIYAWDEDGNSLLGDWPGTAMTYYGENAYGEAIYAANIPEKAVGMVFAAGMNYDQTVDVTPDKNHFRPTLNRDDSGHIILLGWDDNEQQILFINNLGWKDVYCYWWENEDDNGWPSTKMTYWFTVEYGDAAYTANIPVTAKYIVFSNGEDVQTVDLEFDPNVTGWYINGFQDGKATCGTW